jgi:hypothetical protein
MATGRIFLTCKFSIVASEMCAATISNQYDQSQQWHSNILAACIPEFTRIFQYTERD